MAAPCLCSPSSAHPLSVVTCWIGAAVKVCLGCGVSCRVALTYRLSHILVITNQRILALQAFHLSVHCYLVETSPSVPSVFYFFQRPPSPEPPLHPLRSWFLTVLELLMCETYRTTETNLMQLVYLTTDLAGGGPIKEIVLILIYRHLYLFSKAI